MAKRRNLSTLGASGRAAAQTLIEQDHEVEEGRQRESDHVRLLRLDQIKARPGTETRTLRPKLVLELLCSIDALGLIEPLAVDCKHRLLAGGHRLMALRMLASTPTEALQRFEALSPSVEERASAQRILKGDPNRVVEGVPVRVFDFDAVHAPERAFSVEAAENTVRRDYTPAEVRALYERLRGMKGFSATRGRPKKGARPVIPELAAILGKSAASIHRYLQEDEPQEIEVTKRAAARKRLQGLVAAIKRLEREACGLNELTQVLEILGNSTLDVAIRRALDALDGEGNSLI